MEGKPGETDEAVDAVLCVRRIADDGSVTVDPQPVGDMRLTEVDSVLELARQRWRQKIGLR